MHGSWDCGVPKWAMMRKVCPYVDHDEIGVSPNGSWWDWGFPKWFVRRLGCPQVDRDEIGVLILMRNEKGCSQVDQASESEGSESFGRIWIRSFFLEILIFFLLSGSKSSEYFKVNFPQPKEEIPNILKSKWCRNNIIMNLKCFFFKFINCLKKVVKLWFRSKSDWKAGSESKSKRLRFATLPQFVSCHSSTMYVLYCTGICSKVKNVLKMFWILFLLNGW